MAGLLTLYLVTTALLTVRQRTQGFDWMGAGAMVFALILGLLSIAFGIQGLSDTGNTNGITPIGFIFGAVALLAAFGDARLLLARSFMVIAQCSSFVAHVLRAVDRCRFFLSWVGR